MTQRLRLSPQTILVLETFLDAPKSWRYGYDISRDTALKSGTLYPILMRLAEHELVETSWESTAAGTPPRHMYRLTPAGVQSAKSYVREHTLRRTARATLLEAEG